MWNEIFLFLSSPHLFILGIELCLPGWRFSMTMVASFLMVGGQLLMPGVAALCRNWPDRDDWQVLQIVIISPFVLMLPYVWWVPPSEEFHSRRGPILLVLSQAMACTVHTALHRTEHSSPTNKQCSLSPVLSCSSPFCFFFLLSQPFLFSSFFVCSLHILPVPLSAGFFPSRCAGCWPPSTTGDPKPWCCASPGRTRLTWQPSQVEFLQVRKISGRMLNKDEWSKIHLAINVYFLLLYSFHYANYVNSSHMLSCSCFLVCDEMDVQWTQRHWLTYKDFSCEEHVEVAAFPNSYMMKCNCNQTNTYILL